MSELRVEVIQLHLSKELALNDLTLPVGTIIDCIQINSDTYKIFVCNRWWVVDSSCFHLMPGNPSLEQEEGK